MPKKKGKRGKRRMFDFHGAFKSKSDAVRRERAVKGFIREGSVHGQKRFFVMSKKG